MGVTCAVHRVNDSDLRRLREAPEDVFTFLYGEAVPLETVREPGLMGFITRLLGEKLQQVSATETAAGSANPLLQRSDHIDLDKAWHGLHFLFTGTAEEGEEPACFLLRGGEEIGNEDVGPARVLRPDQVSQFAAFLAELSRDELARRYDPPRMTALEIYPEVIWTRPGEPAFEYLFEAFEDLRDFVNATSTKGDSLIVSII